MATERMFCASCKSTPQLTTGRRRPRPGIPLPPAARKRGLLDASATRAPEEIAVLIAYLCSDDASFITGANIPIDGGFITLNN